MTNCEKCGREQSMVSKEHVRLVLPPRSTGDTLDFSPTTNTQEFCLYCIEDFLERAHMLREQKRASV